VIFGNEELTDALLGHVCGNIEGVRTGPGLLYRCLVEVGGEYLGTERPPACPAELIEDHGNGISFLPRRAAGDPDPDRVSVRPVREEPRQHLLLERPEGIRVPEKARHPDEELPEEKARLLPVLVYVLKVLLRIVNTQHTHPPPYPTVDGVPLVDGVIMTRRLFDDCQDTLNDRLHYFRGHVGGDPREMEHVPFKEFSHLLGGYHVVHDARTDGALRHLRILGRGRLLGHGDAAGAVYLAQTDSAVRAGARQDDADHSVAPFRGQGAKEKVDGHAYPVDYRGGQGEDVALEGEKLVRRDDVGPTRFDLRSPYRLRHGHLRGPREDIDEHARPVGLEVLNEDEGRLQAGREVREERLERLDAPCRRTYPHYREDLLRVFFLPVLLHRILSLSFHRTVIRPVAGRAPFLPHWPSARG